MSTAEGARFELADPIAEVGGLATRWFKPLTQPSIVHLYYFTRFRC